MRPWSRKEEPGHVPSSYRPRARRVPSPPIRTGRPERPRTERQGTILERAFQHRVAGLLRKLRDVASQQIAHGIVVFGIREAPQRSGPDYDGTGVCADERLGGAARWFAAICTADHTRTGCQQHETARQSQSRRRISRPPTPHTESLWRHLPAFRQAPRANSPRGNALKPVFFRPLRARVKLCRTDVQPTIGRARKGESSAPGLSAVDPRIGRTCPQSKSINMSPMG